MDVSRDAVRTALQMSTDEYALISMLGTTGTPIELKKTAFALRTARSISPETYACVLSHALTARAEWRRWHTLTQRKWQTNATRRSARNKNWDTAEIRERYLRCKNS